MPIISDKAIKLNEAHSGNLKWWTTNILIPTKVSMAIKLYSRQLNFSNIFAKKKYIERNPRMAKILELKTKKGSDVIASIAGTLSKANSISITSITIKATKSGVA